LSDPAAIKLAIIEKACALGFDAAGITRADATPETRERLKHFIAEGAHGDMDWLAATAERRGAPQALWPEVRSVVMLGLNYGPDDDPLAILAQRGKAEARLGPIVSVRIMGQALEQRLCIGKAMRCRVTLGDPEHLGRRQAGGAALGRITALLLRNSGRRECSEQQDGGDTNQHKPPPRESKERC